VEELLFELATWHAFAKLRLHTESTLQSFDVSTSGLGQILRRFRATTCEEFHTQELPSEEAARGRRRAAKVNNQISSSQQNSKRPTKTRKRKFNLETFKLHALGHYVNAIRMYGTTDSYSTQLVRHYHCPLFPAPTLTSI
jgi:hypothetical protein